MEQWLNQWVQRWQIRGASPTAIRLSDDAGWLLTLCGRAKLVAWLIFALFGGALALVPVVQVFDPQPLGKFLLLMGGFSLFAAGAAFYVMFAYWYRVLVNDQGLVQMRFLVPTQRLLWDEVGRLEFNEGDELLKLHSREGRKVSLYLSLHGLSVLRRFLHALSPTSATSAPDWLAAEERLMRHVPAWRSSAGE